MNSWATPLTGCCIIPSDTGAITLQKKYMHTLPNIMKRKLRKHTLLLKLGSKIRIAADRVSAREFWARWQDCHCCIVTLTYICWSCTCAFLFCKQNHLSFFCELLFFLQNFKNDYEYAIMLQQNVYEFIGVQFPAIIANYNIFNYCYVNILIYS